MFRRLFFGLGVLLGLVAPQAGPALSARIWRDAESLRLNLELEGAFPAPALELAAQGTEVAWRLEASAAWSGEASTTRYRRSLRHEGASGLWVVRLEPEGEEKRLRDRAAAVILASRLWSARLAGLPPPGQVLQARISLAPGIVDEAGGWHEAGLLWGFAEPGAAFSYGTVTEIPY